MFERSQPSYKPIWGNSMAPQVPENFGAPLKGAGKPLSPHVFILKMLSFLLPPRRQDLCCHFSLCGHIDLPQHGGRLHVRADTSENHYPQRLSWGDGLLPRGMLLVRARPQGGGGHIAF